MFTILFSLPLLSFYKRLHTARKSQWKEINIIILSTQNCHWKYRMLYQDYRRNFQYFKLQTRKIAQDHTERIMTPKLESTAQ